MTRFATLPTAVCLVAGPIARADVVIKSAALRLVLDKTGTWKSLRDTRTGRELCYTGRRTGLVDARINGKTDRVASLAYEAGQLHVAFAKNDTRLVYAVEPGDRWITFTLERVTGTRPSHLTMLRVPVAITDRVGRRLGIAWDKDTAVCLMAANMQAFGGGRSRGKWAELTMVTQDSPGPALEGSAAALIVCPTAEVRKVLHEASVAFGLLTNTRDGVPVKDLPEVKRSYWFTSFAERDVDKMIDYCRRTGFTQVMMGFGSWCAAAGHYPFRTANYPDGKEGLKRVVDKLHAAGILVGMHTFASKVSKRDAYVTPVPDTRFWKDIEITLAEAVTADATEIRVAGSLAQWPASPVCKRKYWEGGVRKHQEVIIGKEIVQYEAIGPEGVHDTFLGCTRGAWGTRPAAHRAGTTGTHYGVDGCINGYIIDQETTLLDEVSTRLTDIYNTCGFDMIYFDGGEDVDRRRFTYYVTKFQDAVMRKITKRPIIHQGTIMTHGLWHSFARTGTVDTYMNTMRGHAIAGGNTSTWRSVKEHIDLSVKRALSYQQDLIPSELGWFGIWPKNRYSDGLQLDEAEYLMTKSLAYDLPLSLQTGFSQLENHPLTPQILQIVKVYEALRLAGSVDEATRAKLRTMGEDVILVHPYSASGEYTGGTTPAGGRRGEPGASAPGYRALTAGLHPPLADFVRVHEMPKVAGTHDVRAFVGDYRGGAVATVWHYVGDGTLLLNVDPGRLRATTFMGEPIKLQKGKGTVMLTVGSRRTTLLFDGMSADEARAILAAGTFEARKPVMLWIQAEDFTRRDGKMARGSAVGVAEPDAFGDVVVSTGPCYLAPGEYTGGIARWYCEYRVTIPRAGRWTVWGRVRYPSGTDESFGLVPEGEEPTLQGRQVFGNCGKNDRKWHWTGRGGGSTTVPPGTPIRLTLPKGPFTFRVYAREAGRDAKGNPRLDCICLCDDPAYVPADADARAALHEDQ